MSKLLRLLWRLQAYAIPQELRVERNQHQTNAEGVNKTRSAINVLFLYSPIIQLASSFHLINASYSSIWLPMFTNNTVTLGSLLVHVFNVELVPAIVVLARVTFVHHGSNVGQYYFIIQCMLKLLSKDSLFQQLVT